MTSAVTAPEPAEAGAAPRGLADFHPAVRTWFERRFPEGPSEPQAQGWPLIASGVDTLVAAPTGSGKTLAGFLVAIDALYRAHDAGEPVTDIARVVYVSPLKALAVDIAENLDRPLDEIAAVAAELGLDAPDIRVAVRTGDTTSSQRSLMVRRPPSFVVTTPESLYLLVTSARGREALRTVDTVIVDEIHAVARDKRGAHLALTLERLEALCDRRPMRIGLSATQRPIETVGRLLVGDRALPAVVDVGHLRDLDLALELPEGELEAVASAEQMGDVLDRIAALVGDHRTTLVFVNTRRLAERLAHELGERLGDDVVAAHHGSLSKERRHRVETRLRAGDLKVAGGHRVARARHRHRAGRARLPDRVAAQHRHVPAAGRPLQPQPGWHPQGPTVPADPRRAGRVQRPAGGGACRPPRRHPPRRACRSTSPPSRSWPRWRRRSGAPTTCTNWCAERRRTPS